MKLIRDKLVNAIDHERLKVVDAIEVHDYATIKIHEELKELIDSEYLDINEYADLIEIIIKVANLNSISEGQIFDARKIKENTLGVFKDNLILVK